MSENECASLRARGWTETPEANAFGLIEVRCHGSEAFPAAFYTPDLIDADIAWHWHTEFEVGVVSGGDIELMAGSQRALLHAGDGVFINSGVLHGAINAAPSHHAVLDNIVFHGRLIAGHEQSVFDKRYVAPVMQDDLLRVVIFRGDDPSAADTLRRLHSAMQAMTKQPTGYEITVRSELSSLFVLLCGMASGDRARGASSVVREKRARSMMDYIHAHFAEQLRLEDVAQAVAVSPNEAMRCFKQILGVSPIQYLKHYRLSRAAHMLKSHDASIAEICEKCGFRDGSYFAKEFRALYRCAPRAYREL